MFDADEFKEFAEFLKRKTGIDHDELLDHFYFNREMWRKHVRTYRPDAEYHAERIRKVHLFVAEHMEKETIFTEEVKKLSKWV